MKPALDKKATELMLQIHEIIRRYRMRQRDFVKKVDTDLNDREIDMLLRLGLEGERTMSQLAAEIVVSLSSATMIVDKLVRKGIVRREASAKDRRVVVIRLTKGGERKFTHIYQNFMLMVRTMLQSLSSREQDTLLDLYRKMARKL
jgi:MarR family 2-MHQ and catechol resistance regulon transcriptional repressor